MISNTYFKKIRHGIKGSISTDVTGGMLHKVTESLLLAGKGAKIIIINGNNKDELLKTLLNKPHQGTEIIQI